MRTADAARCSRRTRPRTRSAPLPRSRRRCPSRLPSGTRLARSHPPIFFSAPSQALEHPRVRRVANLQPAGLTQELAPLGESGRRALLHVPLQEPPGRFVHFRFGARALLRGQRPPLARRSSVALDGRDPNAEGLGDLDGGHAPFLGLDDLLPQVQRVRVHGRILPRCPITLQEALTTFPAAPTPTACSPAPMDQTSWTVGMARTRYAALGLRTSSSEEPTTTPSTAGPA